MAGFSLFLPLGESRSSFNLEKAVCNHGFFMMAPNRWIPSSKTLQRPLRLADSTTCVTVSILHPPNHTSLLVRVHGVHNISEADQHAILVQVARMLRISERDDKAVREYQKVHPEAKKRGFGRVFRSPTLFEDLVKCLLLCNCTWSKTLKMARALCELQFELSNNATARSGVKRKREKSNPWPCKVTDQLDGGFLGNFPSSKELASLDQSTLKEKHNILGYRGKDIRKLARDVERGRIPLHEFEEAVDDTSYINQEQVFKKVMKINGFGLFASATALMCIGFYQKVPLDTETIRHLKQVHGRKNCNRKTAIKDVEEIYNKYAPFQCLAYWLELLDFYESKFGKLSELPSSSYQTVSGTGRLE